MGKKQTIRTLRRRIDFSSLQTFVFIHFFEPSTTKGLLWAMLIAVIRLGTSIDVKRRKDIWEVNNFASSNPEPRTLKTVPKRMESKVRSKYDKATIKMVNNPL